MSREVDILQPEDGKDYILQVKVKNGPLLRAIRLRGHKSASAFAKATGVSFTAVCNYLGLARAPLNKKGDWHESILKIAHALRLPPASLFPEQHLDQALAKSSGELEISREEVELIMAREALDPEQIMQQDQISDTIARTILCLTPREQEVVRGRFGFDGDVQTLDQLAQQRGVGKERIRQIEARALRKLQHPHFVKVFADVGVVDAQNSIARRRRLGGQDGY